MHATLGLGEPWYTSGVQKWNGTAATLNPKPTSSRARPASSRPVSAEHGGGEEVGDVGEVRGAGGAVDEGDAVEEEGRAERAQHEVLDAGLLRVRRRCMAASTYTAIDRISRPRNMTMRSLADAMTTPPDADSSSST